MNAEPDQTTSNFGGNLEPPAGSNINPDTVNNIPEKVVPEVVKPVTAPPKPSNQQDTNKAVDTDQTLTSQSANAAQKQKSNA